MSATAAAMDDPAGDPEWRGLRSADYCRIAEECFVMAALTKDPEAAAELVKAGDDYLRRADELLGDHLKTFSLTVSQISMSVPSCGWSRTAWATR
jgi:hypothetical protein